jgi:hypothetical protein
MNSFDVSTISNALALINGLISASAHTEEYRQMVAKAIAEGRDISDEELASVAKRIEESLAEAQTAAQNNPNQETLQ